MKKRRAVEIRGSTLPVLQIVVRDCDPQSLEHEMTTAVAKARLLLDEAVAVLDLRERDSDNIPPSGIVGVARSAGARLAAVLVRSSDERAPLADADLPVIEMPLMPSDRPAMPQAVEEREPARAAGGRAAAEHVEAASVKAAGGEVGCMQAAALGPPAPLYVTQPVRSGQRLYAQGRDLVVLAPTSRGAELIADGSIYAFVPLRGRALAGAGGDRDACIIATLLDAELIAVAGVYRTLEAADLGGFGDSAVSVTLAFDAEGSERLLLRPVGSLPSLRQGEFPRG
jgi:septum site-determining protein MinC